MKILRTVKKLNKAILNISNLGFVPTMGGIHKGHISLVKKSKKKSKKTLVSIFINPTQFNNRKDFINYPKNINRDLILLKKNGVDFVFIPKSKEIYKHKRSKKIKISIKKNVLCGKFRKGHFEGVVDVVERFISIIKPKYLFLGEKDFQQLYLIKKYFQNNSKIKIIQCKTVRDKNYLALSSRNFLLSKQDLLKAGEIAKKLKLFKEKIRKKIISPNKITSFKNYLVRYYNIKIDYLELRNENNLEIFKKKSIFKLFVAYYIKKIRLIDNF